MGHTLGLALQGRFNDPVPLVLRIVHFAPATRSDLPDLPDALLVHTLAPKLHRGPAHAESLGDRYILLTRHRSQDNSAAQRHLLRRPVRGFPLLQLCARRRLQLDLQTFVRHDWDHTKHWNYVKLFMGHYTSTHKSKIPPLPEPLRYPRTRFSESTLMEWKYFRNSGGSV